MGKRKPDKNHYITVNLFHEGVFTVPPFKYAHSNEKQITDILFEGTALRISIKPLKNDSNVDQFVNFAYQNKWEVNLYVEHSGYDALDIRDQGKTIVDDEVIKTVTTNDPFLNKLCFDSGQFINFIDKPVNVNVETVVKDTKSIDFKFNVKQGITYLRHDPTQDWNKIELVLGMRFEHPEQLKLCLTNYRVANGYQLWYKRNDRRKVLVYCGRDVEAGRCAGSKTDEGTSKYPKTPMKDITSREDCMLPGCHLSILSKLSLSLRGIQIHDAKRSSDKNQSHKKSSCKKERVTKPPKVNRRVLPKPIEYRTYASARGRGRGSRGGRGGRGEGSATMGEGNDGMSESGGAGGRSQRGKGREHEYIEEILLEEEQKREANQKTKQDEFDQEALRHTLEEEARYKREDEERLREQRAEEEWERKHNYFHHSNWTQEEESFDHEPYNKNVMTVDANVQTQ
ncbi:hypothetical protein Tco_0753015 [Tanacetum coccineum]